MIHLVTSMILMVFLLMYTFTGIIISHHNLPVGEQKVEHTRMSVEKTMDSSPSSYARYLKQRFDFKGQYEYVQHKNGNWDFYFLFPGEYVKATLVPDQDSLLVEKTYVERTLSTVAQDLHRLRGFQGGWIYTAWAIFYDLSALALILFGVTGIVMWLKHRRRYPSGHWYLLAGIAIPLAVVLAFMFSR